MGGVDACRHSGAGSGGSAQPCAVGTPDEHFRARLVHPCEVIHQEARAGCITCLLQRFQDRGFLVRGRLLRARLDAEQLSEFNNDRVSYGPFIILRDVLPQVALGALTR